MAGSRQGRPDLRPASIVEAVGQFAQTVAAADEQQNKQDEIHSRTEYDVTEERPIPFPEGEHQEKGKNHRSKIPAFHRGRSRISEVSDGTKSCHRVALKRSVAEDSLWPCTDDTL